LGTLLDDTQILLDGPYHCTKLVGNWKLKSFANTKILIFLVFGLKMPIHVPFKGVMWVEIK